MQRITITLDDDLLAEVDHLVAARGYQGRSEAMRDLARAGLQQVLLETDAAQACVATLIYVFDHGARELARRLTQRFHDHHDLTVATMHIHLNHESGMQIAVLKGSTASVRHLAEAVLAERGVRHGRLFIVPAVMDAGEHAHAGDPHRHTHIRTR